MGRPRLGARVGYSGLAARELVAGWSNLLPRLAEAQLLGGLGFLQGWEAHSFWGWVLLETCHLLFVSLSPRLASGTMDVLSAASHLGRQLPGCTD